jgi:hypothetical protein
VKTPPAPSRALPVGTTTESLARVRQPKPRVGVACSNLKAPLSASPLRRGTPCPCAGRHDLSVKDIPSRLLESNRRPTHYESSLKFSATLDVIGSRQLCVRRIAASEVRQVAREDGAIWST